MSKVPKPVMVFSGEPSMLSVLFSVLMTAVPVPASSSSSVELLPPTMSLPENCRLPPAAPSSGMLASSPTGLMTERLSVNSPGKPTIAGLPTVMMLLVKMIDPLPSVPAEPVAPGALTPTTIVAVAWEVPSLPPMPPMPTFPSAESSMLICGAVKLLPVSIAVAEPPWPPFPPLPLMP